MFGGLCVDVLFTSIASDSLEFYHQHNFLPLTWNEMKANVMSTFKVE